MKKGGTIRGRETPKPKKPGGVHQVQDFKNWKRVGSRGGRAKKISEAILRTPTQKKEPSQEDRGGGKPVDGRRPGKRAKKEGKQGKSSGCSLKKR